MSSLNEDQLQSQAMQKEAMAEIKAIMQKYQCVGSVVITQGKGIAEHALVIESPWSVAFWDETPDGRTALRVKTTKQNKDANPVEKEEEFVKLDRTINALMSTEEVNAAQAQGLHIALTEIVSAMDTHKKHGEALAQSLGGFLDFAEAHSAKLEALASLNKELAKLLNIEAGPSEFIPDHMGKN